MINYDNRILITGFGVVAQATLPLLLQHVRVPLSNIRIIDFEDVDDAVRPWVDKGVRFVKERITRDNLERLLSTYLGPGDLIIDLAWSVGFFEIVSWAHSNRVIYVNASLESWDGGTDGNSSSLIEKSLYRQYQKLLSLVKEWKSATTVVIDHGSNPGLVSHFVKQGLLDIGSKLIGENRLSASRAEQLMDLIDKKDFARLARALDVKVIHCSEWDTQRASRVKQPNEFVSTWSVEGMWGEAISPSELGWGTHEKWLPSSVLKPQNGSTNHVILPQMGLNTWVHSCVPEQEIVGMIVPHGEAFSIARALTVYDDGRPVYRPTVHYAYLPCNDSIVSLHELRCRNYRLHPRKRILTNEITEGKDLVGALIMGHPYQSWWTGSILSIDEARRSVPTVNATAVQVAAGVMTAALWAIQNPMCGVCFPEDLPHEPILNNARPYLGQWVSRPLQWTPPKQRPLHPESELPVHADPADPWQFSNFLFRP